MKNHIRLFWVHLMLMFSMATFGCRSAEKQKKLDVQLCKAAFEGDLPAIGMALKLGANPNTKQCGEFSGVGYPTPLFFAILGYDKKVGDYLSGRSEFGSDDKQKLVVLALLAAGANPNMTSNTTMKETPLMYAEALKADGIKSALLKNGADSKILDANGKSAKDYSELTGDDLIQAAGGHLIIRFAIINALKELAEKDLIEQVVPKK